MKSNNKALNFNYGTALEISKYLTLSDLKNSVYSSKNFIFFQEPINKLKVKYKIILDAVIKGEETQAKILFNINPELLLIKSNFIDNANRKFKRFSPFQYAFWAYDVPLLILMLKSFTEEQKKQALKQMYQLKNTSATKYGSHYNFAVLHALEQYFHKHLTVSNKIKNKNLKKMFYKIGLAQSTVPTNIAQAFCDPNNKSNFGYFDRTNLCRKMKFYLNDKLASWFPINDEENDKENYRLGHDFIIVIDKTNLQVIGMTFEEAITHKAYDPMDDWTIVHELKKYRIQQIEEIEADLFKELNIKREDLEKEFATEIRKSNCRMM